MQSEELDCRGGVRQLFCVMGVGVIKPRVDLKKEGLGCFARVQYGMTRVIRYVGGTLMYSSLYRNRGF